MQEFIKLLVFVTLQNMHHIWIVFMIYSLMFFWSYWHFTFYNFIQYFSQINAARHIAMSLINEDDLFEDNVRIEFCDR